MVAVLVAIFALATLFDALTQYRRGSPAQVQLGASASAEASASCPLTGVITIEVQDDREGEPK